MENSVNKDADDEVTVLDEPKVDELDTQEDNSDGDKGNSEPDVEEGETEIILREAGDGSRPSDQSNLGIRKRINKLNAKVSEAKTEARDTSTELEAERQKNKLLQLALEQKQEAASTPQGPPDPLDYDDGARDAKYVTALNDYTIGLMRTEMAKQSPEPQKNDELEVKQTQHYEAAEKLKLRDYDDVEDVAVGILGKDNVNHLIQNGINTPATLYYLGKNPEKAERLAELVRRNPIKGVMELGALGASLTATKAKRNQAPNPDAELEGTTSPRSRKRGPEGATYS